MRLHQQLENTLKIRINSNDDIVAGIKRLSELGKFDEPKKIAMLAIILDRLGKMEDEAMIAQSVKEDMTTTALEDIATPEELKLPNESTIDFAQTDEEPLKGVENPPIESNPVETLPTEPANPTAPEVEAPSSASGDVVASSEQDIPAATDTPIEDTATISNFNLDAIQDKPQPDPTTTS